MENVKKGYGVKNIGIRRDICVIQVSIDMVEDDLTESTRSWEQNNITG